MLHIKSRAGDNASIRLGCFICGEGFELQDMTFDVVDADGKRLHEMVCYACAELDAAGIQAALSRHAEK